jgi:hypothetical protein
MGKKFIDPDEEQKQEPKKFNDPDEPLKIGVAGFPDALREVIAEKKKTAHPGATEVGAVGLAGAGSILDDASLRLKQLVTGGLSPEDQLQVQANRVIRSDPAGLGGAVAGGAGMFGPMGVSSILGNTALGAGVGGLAQPVLEGESGTLNTIGGAAAGFAGGLLGKLLTGSPLVKPTEPTKRLLKEGVVPTIGQNAASSQSGAAQALGRMEEKAASMPVVGDFISGARRRALADFNKAAIQKAMPEGSKVARIGAEGVDEALEAAGGAFERAYAGSKAGPSQALTQALQAAKDKPAVGLSNEAAKKFDRVIDRLVTQRLKPDMDAGLIKKTIESDLGKEARNFKFSSNSDDRALGEALMAARDAVRDALQSAVGSKSAVLPGLNKAYAAGKTLEKAAERASATGGVFTPYQLQKAAGSGVLRPLADDAQSVLSSRVPNSGTTDRALQALLATGQVPQTGTLGYLGGSLLTAPMYSRLGSQFMLGDLTPEMLQALAPYLAQAGRGVLSTPR